MPRVPSIVGLVIGIFGIVCGLAAVVTTLPALGLVAGVAALIAGVLYFQAAKQMTQAAATGAAVPAAPYSAALPDEDARESAATMASPALFTAAEEDLNSDRTEADALTDPATGLYTENYLMVALDARIAAARRRLRPVALALVEVVADLATGEPSPGDAIDVSAAIRATIRAADTASRLGDGRYAIVLEDTPENGAIWTIERLRSALVSQHANYTVWAGVACYPSHAFNVEEIVEQATSALNQAREWRQDRIEVATAD